MANWKLSAFADEASPMIDGQIAALVRNDIPYLEVRGVDKKNIKDITPNEAKELKKRLDDGGVSVWSMGSPIGKIRLDGNMAGHLEDFKRILECADILGAKRIRMFSFYPAPEDSAEATKDKALEAISSLLDLTPNEILLCHENEKDIFGENAENCHLILKTFPRLRGVFDPANFVQCGVDTLKAWELLKEHIDYLHIKDAMADGSVVPAGEGLGNVPYIVRDYLSRGGEVMTLEPHLNHFVGLDALENGESLKNSGKRYASNDESFDAAVAALKGILANI
ncbi:MAG: sugar phosphate isomerase/epimerase [Clostridia bacterium]|nr:sugar phosphate isomerase/epimerase [Clostridia bacterium]